MPDCLLHISVAWLFGVLSGLMQDAGFLAKLCLVVAAVAFSLFIRCPVRFEHGLL